MTLINIGFVYIFTSNHPEANSLEFSSCLSFSHQKVKLFAFLKKVSSPLQFSLGFVLLLLLDHDGRHGVRWVIFTSEFKAESKKIRFSTPKFFCKKSQVMKLVFLLSVCLPAQALLTDHVPSLYALFLLFNFLYWHSVLVNRDIVGLNWDPPVSASWRPGMTDLRTTPARKYLSLLQLFHVIFHRGVALPITTVIMCFFPCNAWMWQVT